MTGKKIKFIIDSNLENLSLIGLVVNKLCSLVPFSELEADRIELCVLEAMTNSIKHAYGNRPGHEVEVTFCLCPEKLTLDVCDTGISMPRELFEQKDISALKINPDNIVGIPKSGRGLAIIKEIMNEVAYKTEEGKNCLIMIKRIDKGAKKED